MLEAPEQHELALLRCQGLDHQVLVDVLGRAVPADMLTTATARAGALAPEPPAGFAIAGRTALWVHTGGEAPAELELLRAVPATDVVTLAGVPCLRLARTVVDLARTAPPTMAVHAVLQGRRAGLTRRELESALLSCRGGSMRGLRRARRLIDDLYAPLPEYQTDTHCPLRPALAPC